MNAAMKLRLCAVATVAALTLIGSPAMAQPTAFTYQGQLKNGGSPADGSFDMTFRLFDADSDGNQVGGDIPVKGVTVSGGLFTTQVDFGAVFSGAPLWLEIQVSDQVLSPRQPLTSAPYAQTCENAYYSSYSGYAYAPWQASGADLYYNDGNIGIGTSTPTARLEIAGAPGVDGLKFPDGTVQVSAAVGGSGFWSSNGSDIYNNNSGVVGIGRSNPGFRLDTNTTNGLGARFGMEGAGGGALVIACNPGDNRVWLEGYNSTDNGNATEMLLTGYAGGAIPQLTLNATTTYAAGRVGVGTTTPGYPMTIKTSSLFPSYGMVHTNGTVELGSYVSGTGGWLGTRSAHPLYFFTGDSSPQVTLTTAGNFGIGTTSPAATLDVNGTTRTKTVQITGADVAEKFPTSDGRAEPGTVMEIDSEHPGKLHIARAEYSARVAGVVSGAGDLPVGAELGHLPGNEDAPAIALSGRVWVKCDSSKAPIAPGDLLTTSNVPGHAMRAIDRDRSYGAIIGKAMTPLQSGKGLVLVLVNLQ
ncbi:MAG TPA: hypothetical protein VMV81_01060 [Phycisphaerae bacterium]|nr:hypothetical protein [Phycisphaerae bacterium]